MLQLREGLDTRTYIPEPWDDRYECMLAGWGMEREVQELIWGLVRALRPALVIETGTWIGSTAEVIGNALEDNGEGYLVTIEIDPNCVESARRRCAHLPRVEVVHGDCVVLASNWQNIDLLVIDGGERAPEHAAFEPFLAPNAIVLRHDTLRGGDRIQPGELDGFDTVTLHTPRGLSISQRPVVSAE